MSHVALLGDSIFDNAAYVAAEAAIAVLSLTGGSEYLEFAIAMVMFVAILVGSYLFVVATRAARWAARAARGVVCLYRAGVLVGAPAFCVATVAARCNRGVTAPTLLVSSMSKGRAAGGGERVQYGIVGIVVVVILVIVVLQFL